MTQITPIQLFQIISIRHYLKTIRMFFITQQWTTMERQLIHRPKPVLYVLLKRSLKPFGMLYLTTMLSRYWYLSLGSFYSSSFLGFNDFFGLLFLGAATWKYKWGSTVFDYSFDFLSELPFWLSFRYSAWRLYVTLDAKQNRNL